MKVYHYTSFLKIGAILGKQRGEHSGLEPRRRVGLMFSNLDDPKAIFGLLEPMPDDWVNNPHFQVTWRTLVHDLRVVGNGALLLGIEVDSEDKAFVGERAHLEGVIYSDRTGIPSEFLHEHQSEAERAYLESMIPLNEYVERQQAGNVRYSLPEVVILSPIPSERVAVSSQQPLIEDDLARSGGGERSHLVRLITEGWAQSELLVWRETYEAKYGRLEQQASGKERL